MYGGSVGSWRAGGEGREAGKAGGEGRELVRGGEGERDCVQASLYV